MKYLIILALLLCSCTNSSTIREKELSVDTSKVEVKAITDTIESKTPITFEVQLEDWENSDK